MLLMSSKLKIWLIIIPLIFVVLALWAFGVHESMHILACDASGLQGSLVDYRTGNCAGLDTASSATFFLVKSAPYLVDVLAALLLWFLARRLDFVCLLKGGTRGVAIFAALNAWALAVLFDVASNYAGSLIGFTDFFSIIAFDKALLVPAMVVTFVALLFTMLFFWEEWMKLRPQLRGR